MAIAYKSNVTDVQPEDFTVFSVNQTCVWTIFMEFQVPARMPFALKVAVFVLSSGFTLYVFSPSFSMTVKF